MSVIRWLVMQEVCLGLNLPRHFESHLASLLYAHANITTSDEHSNVTMLHSTRTTYSFKDGWVGGWVGVDGCGYGGVCWVRGRCMLHVFAV